MSICSRLRSLVLLPAALSLCTVFVSVPTASAVSYLKCLEQSEGQILTWDTRWSSDRSDSGAEYEVVKVSTVNKIPERLVTLELQARSRGAAKRRRISAETEEKARLICENLSVERRRLSLPGERSRIPSEPPEYSLPFIRYTKDGWVRAKRPERVYELAVCRVLQREFSCLSSEKDRFGIMLKTVEEEIRWSGGS